MATTLVYTVSPFVPFTKIVSADVNTLFFTNLRNRINWSGGTDATTGLGDENLQSNAASGGGLTRSTKLKLGTAHAIAINSSTGALSDLAPSTAGYFLTTNGPSLAPTWSPNPLLTQYSRVVGSAADVSSGAAGYSSLNAAIAASTANDTILILKSYNTVENSSIDKRLFIQGQGYGSTITGTLTFGTSSNGSRVKDIRVTENVTINSGVDEIYCDITIATTKTFIDNSAVSDTNYLLAMQED